jgi:RNA polymerase sigma-70 factor (ECF subfamily)
MKNLIERIKMGDAYAFDELISKYRLLIKSIAFHILQHRQDVEDCENESMTRIWQAICNNKYRYDGSFKAYIATITANVAITMLKKKIQESNFFKFSLNHVSFKDDEEETIDPVDPTVDVEILAVLKENHEELMAALAVLPLKQSRSIVLTQLEGMSYSDVAKQEGVAEGTIKSRVSRGIKMLAQIMNSSTMTKDEINLYFPSKTYRPTRRPRKK